MEFFEELLNFGEEVSNSAPLSDRLIMGLQTALLGMGVIFTVLILLWAVLSVFKLVFYKGKAEKKAEPLPVPTPAAVESAPPAPVSAVQNDEEIVAAITAAISMMLDVPQTSFRVVSFRRSAKK